MIEKKKENEQKYVVLSQKIQANERLLDDLHREQRKRIEQLEETTWKVKQQTEQISLLYQELIHFGDSSAYYCCADIQETSKKLQTVLRSQGETVESAYQITDKKLQEKNEALARERGKLKW